MGLVRNSAISLSILAGGAVGAWAAHDTFHSERADIETCAAKLPNKTGWYAQKPAACSAFVMRVSTDIVDGREVSVSHLPAADVFLSDRLNAIDESSEQVARYIIMTIGGMLAVAAVIAANEING